MLHKRTLTLTLIITLFVQLWAASASSAAAGGPVKVSTYPADNEATVPANAKLSIKFDENVMKGTSGTIAVKNSNTNIAAVSYPIADSNISLVTPDTVQIDYPAGTLIAGQSYYVEISPDAFSNSSQTEWYSGINDAISWNFSVIASDNTAPAASLLPVNGGTIAATDALKLTFNEKVTAASGSIRIVRSDTSDTQVISVLSSAVTGSGVVNGSNQTIITIQPPTRLVSGKTYQVQIDPTAFLDVVGNAYSAAAWSFTTLPSAVPLASTIPTDNAVNVTSGAALNAQMVFGVNMVKGSAGYIYLKNVATNVTIDSINMADPAAAARVTVSGPNVGISFNGALVANAGYYIMMDPGVLIDATGNVYEGIVDAVSWNFTTAAGADATPPAIGSTAPASGSTMAALNGSLSIKFNEPVKPGSGTIVIRNTAAPQSVFCSIPVTSSAVVGGGTDTITLTPSQYGSCGNFIKNISYAVQVGSLAITDMSGNPYAGIASNDFSTWWFKVTSDTVQPELISTTPMPGVNNVKPDAALTMIFSEPVMTAGITATVIRQGSGAVVANLVVDGLDPRKVTLTHTDPFAGASTYTVNIPSNAITDLALNPFPGILNDYRWTFQTIGSDVLAPIFSSAAMDGSAIVLTYNEELEPAVAPYPANFYVTVNDVPRQVNGVQIIGNTVRLALQSGVAVGQTVKVSYTLDSSAARHLQDLSGNKAASLTARDVTNTSDTTLARPVSGVLSGTILTLSLNKQLAAVSGSIASQFVVKLNGAAQGVSSATVSGMNIILTLPTTATNVQSVSVSYTPGSPALRDLSSNAVASFTDFYVQNLNDTQPPVLTASTVMGNKVTLTFNEGLKTAPVPLKSNFSILVNGTAAVISTVAVINNSVELTLAQTVASNAIVFVTYIQNSSGILDLAGNQAAAINSNKVVVGAFNAAKFTTATVTGNQLTLNYTAALSSSSLPYASQYYVKVDGIYNGVTGVAVSGTQVNLTLTTAVKTGQVVTLIYIDSGIPLKDTLNQPVDPLAEMTVTNQSSGLVGVPEYLETDGSGGLRLVNAKASTTVSAATPSGRTANRYMISGDKLAVAYDLIKKIKGITVPMVTFKVPTAEAGALVGIPLRSMIDVASQDSNASFRLDYGDLQFTIPLKAINYSKQLQAAGGDISTAYLLLNIEKMQSSPLISALSGRNAQMLATPANFTASILSGGREREIDGYESYVTRTFVLPSLGGANNDDVSVVRIDNESGDVTYVPTTVKTVTGGVNVNFMRKGNSVYAVIRNNTSFSDMTKHWANGDVSMLASKFIIDGPTLTTFAPGKNITRSDFAEFISRGLGLTGSSASAAKFKDVGAGFRSSSYIGAVSDAGIVEGGLDGRFRPNAPVTREEMATMLVRAMKYAGVSISPSITALNGFKDKAEVSSWAKDGMSISVTAGFIKGSTKKMVNPKSNATRAEAAVMIKRFLEYVDFL